MPPAGVHVSGGICLAAIGLGGLHWLGAYRVPIPIMLSLVATSAIAALFPDVDTDSKGRRLYYAVFALLDAGLIWGGEYRWAAVVGLSAILPGLGPHRGWTHTWWAMFLVPLTIVLLPAYLGLAWREFLPFYAAAVAGYFSHLAMDGKL